MQTITTREFQKNLGVISARVMAGECIRVTKRGRPAYLVVPETAMSEEQIRQVAVQRMITMLKTAKVNDAARALTQEKVNALIAECYD